jgi:tRNA 2-thiouridine synthesizing protein A
MEIDVRGEMCPYPAMRAAEALKKLPAGEKLSLITDHAPALSTVPWEGAKLGFAAEITEGGAGEWVIHLEKSAQPLDTKKVLAEIAARAAELAPDEA